MKAKFIFETLKENMEPGIIRVFGSFRMKPFDSEDYSKNAIVDVGKTYKKKGTIKTYYVTRVKLYDGSKGWVWPDSLEKIGIDPKTDKRNRFNESLNEISKEENDWANEQIRRWEMKQKGIDPFRDYINKVTKGIYDMFPEDVLKYTGLTRDMIDDIITSPVEENPVLTMDVYDYYEDYKPVEVAIMELGQQVENYMAGAGDDFN